MALATRCPNCNALFRVAAEQLRSRGGMVRCGSCRSVFNAIAGLDYLDAERLAGEDTGPRIKAAPPPPALHKAAGRTAPAPTPAPLPAIAARGATVPPPTRGGGAERRAVTRGPFPAAPPAPEVRTPAPAPAKPAPAAPAGSFDSAPADSPETLLGAEPEEHLTGFSIANADDESGADAGHGASFEELFAPAAEGAGRSSRTPVQPSFLRSPDAPASALQRGVLLAASVLLAPLLAAQVALIFRAPLIVAFPPLRPALQALCAPLSCTASWPMRPDLLAVVSSELQAMPGTDAFELDTVLRNRAGFPLAVPAIELTVSDSMGHAVLRKVFLPAEFLSNNGEPVGDPAAASIAGGADLAVRVLFELPGGSAAGFEAYPFYP